MPGLTMRAQWLTAAVLATGVAVGTLGVLHAQPQQDLHFLVSFLDAGGDAISDISEDELRLTENGIAGTILQMEQVGRPLDVTLLVDNGIGMGQSIADVRTGARAFFTDLPDGTRMALVTLAPQPRWVQRPTENRRDLLRAVDLMTPDESPSRFLDALVEFGGRLGRDTESRHPIVVAIGSTAPDASTALEQRFRQLAQRLVDHRATVHVAILSSNVRMSNSRIEGVQSNMQQIVGLELSRLTGGRYEPIGLGSRLVSLLPELARQIGADSHRYHVRARRPASATGALGAIAFGIERPGVTINAAFAEPTPVP